MMQGSAGIVLLSGESRGGDCFLGLSGELWGLGEKERRRFSGEF